MTNIVAAVVAVLVTNWTTISRTTPVDPPGTHLYANAVMRYDQLGQQGVIVTNYVALIVWKGHTNQFVLETINAGKEPVYRTISDDAPWRVLSQPLQPVYVISTNADTFVPKTKWGSVTGSTLGQY